MALYVISDLHLSFSTNKPMDIFGVQWENHAEKIAENWRKTVNQSDTVVLPGDISWGSDLSEAYEDLKFIHNLPGQKLIGKGNHDYWWTTIRKMTSFCKEKNLDSINFLYNNAYLYEDKIICGTRGWMSEFGIKSEDERILKREAERLKLSLAEGKKLKNQNPCAEIVVFLHYPPIFGEFMNLDFIDLFYTHNIKKVYYGHLHGAKTEQLDKEYIGISFYLTSCDYLDFMPFLVE